VVQVEVRGPHVAHYSIFSGPRKHSGKIFKSEICWKTCEVAFASLNCLRWMKCTAQEKWIIPFLCSFWFIYLFYDQIRRYGQPLTLRGTLVWMTSVFSVPWRSLSSRVHLAQWTRYYQINLSIYSLNAAYSKLPSSQINCLYPCNA